MRTIKYRAWHPVQRRMFSVYSVIMPKNKNSKNGCKIYVTENIGGRCISWRDVEIMQFSGLKDKNGVDIFEGDILRFEENYPGAMPHGNTAQVIFDLFGFRVRFLKDSTTDALSLMWICVFEVIGNIYENFELLKEGAE